MYSLESFQWMCSTVQKIGKNTDPQCGMKLPQYSKIEPELHKIILQKIMKGGGNDLGLPENLRWCAALLSPRRRYHFYNDR